MLKTIIQPGIALMNQLTYARKLALINIILMTPLLVLSYLQIDTLVKEKTATEHELVGLKLTRQGLTLTHTAGEFRDLIISTQQQRSTAIDNRINQVRDNYLKQLTIIKNDSKHMGQETASTLITKLEQLANSPTKVTFHDVDARYNQANELVQQSWALIRLIANATELSRDRDPMNFMLMKLILDRFETVLEHQGQMRSYGAQALMLGSLHSQLERSINRVINNVMKDYKHLNAILEPLLSAEQSPQSILLAITDGLTLLDDTVMLSQDTSSNWEEYFQQASKTSTTIYEFVEQALNRVEIHLTVRQQQQDRSLYILLVIIIAVLVFANYLMLVFNLSVRRGIQSILTSAQKVAKGDLTSHTSVRGQDELSQLGREFNSMIDQICNLIADVRLMTETVASKSNEVGQRAHSSSNATEKQRLATELVATATNQMAVSIQEVAHSTKKASEESRRVDKEAGVAHLLVEQTLKDVGLLSKNTSDSMRRIEQLSMDSGTISKVVDVIKSIAEQTNLLALNAAIEAARAGDQGRGFAVVADEVRGLAQRTQDSTEEIEQVITRLQKGVTGAVTAMQISDDKVAQTVTNSSEVGQALSRITNIVTSIVEINAHIATASEQQSNVANEIVQKIVSISNTSKQTSVGAKDTEEACQQMTKEANQLQSVVDAFKI